MNFIPTLNKNTHVKITGGCGFLGANFVKHLNSKGYFNITLFERGEWTKKWKNLIGLRYNKVLESEQIFQFTDTGPIINFGANSSTSAEPTLENYNINTGFSNRLIDHCVFNNIRLIHSSSAATYGAEENDFTERNNLTPINFYAWTKLKTDIYLEEKDYPSNIYSLRYFNIFGSALERNKGPMASVIYKWLTQPIDKDSPIQLFKSLRPEFKDGHQERDFFYCQDLCDVIYHCLTTDQPGGVINVGSGKSHTWLEVARTVLKVRGFTGGIDTLIEFIDMPAHLVNSYQYRTVAKIDKLRNQLGYTKSFTSLDLAIQQTWAEINGGAK
jgi:ADP-L-glycero-D-manno-heptose 6-epimerase